MKDIEKAMVGSSDSYTVLKIKLENLPKNVVIIGSHTQMDSRKEKVRNSLFFSVGLFIIVWYKFYCLKIRIWLAELLLPI